MVSVFDADDDAGVDARIDSVPAFGAAEHAFGMIGLSRFATTPAEAVAAVPRG